jgi:RND family efflux transporter MFP subunit
MKRKWALGATIVAIVLFPCVVVVAVLFFSRTPSAAPPGELLVADNSSPRKPLWTCGMHPQVIQDHPGVCPICHMKLTPAKGESDASNSSAGKTKVAYWWDPMLGPASICDHPGKSAMGMDLVPVYENQVSSGPGVRIDPAVVQNMGVRTATVERGPLHVTVRAVGMLEVPEPAITDVALRVGGYVEKLYATTQGMPVVTGQVLFDLYSPDLQVAEQELIAAEQGLKSLDASGSPAVKQEAEGLIDSSRRKLQLWGIAQQDIEAIAASENPPPTTPFRSPADGHIADKSVFEGSSVQPGQKLMRIENHSRLWLDTQVYEDQLESIAVGQMVHASVDGLPGRIFDGAVSFIYPHLDHMARTEIVRTVLNNPDHALRPGMYATAEIVTQPAANVILAPREAIIDTGTRQIAFVADPVQPGHFEPRNVRVGVSGDGDQVQIVEGLAPGEQVVTSGQFLMDVESRTAEAIGKLRGTNAAGITSGGSPDLQTAANPMPTSAPMASMDAMEFSPATPPSTTAPATSSPSVLTVAHCPMKNADWLQIGEVIANPYFGTAMPGCGGVVRTVESPSAGTPLAAVVSAYLKVAGAFDADRLDAPAIRALKAAADAVPGDGAAPLRNATDRLAAATTVDTARAALADEGAALIPLLQLHH